MFNASQITNKALFERGSAFDLLPPIKIPGEKPRSFTPYPALEYHTNGDIVVRMAASGEHEIRVKSFRLAVWQFDILMTNCQNGTYEVVLPASLGLTGNVVIIFSIDGNEILNPNLPTQFYGDKLVNLIEVPDTEMAFTMLRDVSHGSVSRELFWSESVQEWVRCFVYTPPGYEKGGEYPVLYIQHGGGENETGWMMNGKLPYIMDNAIAEGSALPFIVVANNGSHVRPGDTGANAFGGIEDIITQDCRTYIESKYRVRTDKWNRAIAGLSLGSMQAVNIGLRHPELFGSIGSFTYLRCRDRGNTYENNPHLDAFKNPTQFAKDYKLLFRSIGSVELHLNEFEEDDRFLATYGIDQLPCYHRELIPNQTHNWNCWRPAFYHFAQLLFR